MQRILVFDSGVGGLSVLDAIADASLAVELDYLGDSAWLPYGLKTDEQLRDRIPALLAGVVAQRPCDLVVLACNTASTIALEPARAALKVPVVGVVPPIKPAASMTKSGVIALLATPATVQRAYTNDLIAQFAHDRRIIRHGSAALVAAAEAKLRGDAVPRSAITDAIEALFDAPGGAEIDVVALACTHFPLLRMELEAAAPRTCIWLDSGAAIARRVKHIAQAPQGAARMGRANFTGAASTDRLRRAFAARGFNAFAHIGAAPGFALTAI